MDFFGIYVYPAILIIVGALIGGPVGVFATRRWARHRQQQADAIPEGLRKLATQYECAQWIENQDKRVARKGEIFAQMNSFLANHPVQKQRLLDGGHLGRFIALAAAIMGYPERPDAEKILQIQSERLPHGHAQYIFTDSV